MKSATAQRFSSTTSNVPPDRVQRLLTALFSFWTGTATIGHTLALLVFIFVLKGIVVFLVTAYRLKLLSRTGQSIREALIGAYAEVDYLDAESAADVYKPTF